MPVQSEDWSWLASWPLYKKAIHFDGNIIATLVAVRGPESPNIHIKLPLSRQHSRGLAVFLIYQLAKASTIKLLARGSSIQEYALINTLAEILLSNLKVAIIYAFLTRKPEISCCHRAFSWIIWRETFPAMLLYSIAASSGFYLPVFMLQISDLGKSEISEIIGLAKIVSPLVILYFGVTAPTYAIFIRVAASTMEKGCLGLKSAWKSFTWPARSYFLQKLAKVLFTEICVSYVLFVFAIKLFHLELHEAAGLLLNMPGSPRLLLNTSSAI